MKARCCNSQSPAYARYGARGITVCDRWKDSFANFFTDMGERPSSKHQLDRIDNDDNYTPENCRWVTSQVNMRNRSNTLRATYNGETLTLTEWAQRYDLSYRLVKERIQRLGWSIDRALNQKP